MLFKKKKLKNTSQAKKKMCPKASKKAEGKRKKKARDPNAPKRPMTAYFLFSQEHRAEVKKANPEAKVGDIAKILSKMWNEQPESVKEVCDANYLSIQRPPPPFSSQKKIPNVLEEKNHFFFFSLQFCLEKKKKEGLNLITFTFCTSLPQYNCTMKKKIVNNKNTQWERAKKNYHNNNALPSGDKRKLKKGEKKKAFLLQQSKPNRTRKKNTKHLNNLPPTQTFFFSPFLLAHALFHKKLEIQTRPHQSQGRLRQSIRRLQEEQARVGERIRGVRRGEEAQEEVRQEGSPQEKEGLQEIRIRIRRGIGRRLSDNIDTTIRQQQ